MSISPTLKAQLQMHFCVMLWGFTAILGKLISLSALPLVWWRMLLVVLALAMLPTVWRGVRSLPPRLLLAYSTIGVLVALHWLTFYGSIKLANASVAATCIALAAPMTALLEPWLARSRFAWRDLAIGIAVLPGVALVVDGVPSGMRAGVWVGIVSAALVALFGSLQKRYVHRAEALTVTAVELFVGVLALTALAPLLTKILPSLAGDPYTLPGLRDGVLLLTLALACTLLPFALSLVALRHMSAFSAQLVVNLEPVYAIALAIVLLGEQRELTPTFYLGVAIIFVAVFAHPLLKRLRSAPRAAGDVGRDSV